MTAARQDGGGPRAGSEAGGLWRECGGERRIGPIQGLLHRLVESQEHIATLGYVDTLEEQAVLEALLDEAKPSWPAGGECLHYLLRTPFRYPPLPWGSRFGRPHEPSLLYGGRDLGATLAESAYYRFVFWFSMDAPAAGDAIQSQHTLFSVGYRTEHGLRLQDPPFDAHRAALADPARYQATQSLGTAMREAGVEAFEYRSARDPAQGLCVGLFTPRALAGKSPRDMRPWLCQLSAREVAFKPVGGRAVHTYPLDAFLVDGRLPMPA
ncbi:RES family NAD+ phosphorylase [Castellaniella denitrificans]|uniref:RES family NAD+ phosphorylase n=1 Tax=Castellaniella denitrificans TaxID=56119 RepID=UPI00361C4673